MCHRRTNLWCGTAASSQIWSRTLMDRQQTFTWRKNALLLQGRMPLKELAPTCSDTTTPTAGTMGSVHWASSSSLQAGIQTGFCHLKPKLTSARTILEIAPVLCPYKNATNTSKSPLSHQAPRRSPTLTRNEQQDHTASSPRSRAPQESKSKTHKKPCSVRATNRAPPTTSRASPKDPISQESQTHLTSFTVATVIVALHWSQPAPSNFQQRLQDPPSGSKQATETYERALPYFTFMLTDEKFLIPSLQCLSSKETAVLFDGLVCSPTPPSLSVAAPNLHLLT